MSNSSGPFSPTRRNFLATTGGAIAGAVAAPRGMSAATAQSSGDPQDSKPHDRRKILIGVFDPAFPDLTLDQLVEKYQQMGVEAAEIGTGGYPNNKHCALDDLLADPAKLRAWQKKFDDHKIKIAVLSCHGNPVHPDKAAAELSDQTFRKTVQLAERTGERVPCGFAGAPARNPTHRTPTRSPSGWLPELP